jgi:dethiobiotin synthetase
MVDLMQYLNLPVLLVARSAIGTINHTLLSLELLRRYGLEVIGVVMNGPQNSINKHAIETYGHVNVIAEVHPLPHMNFSALVEAFRRYFNNNQ